MLSQAHILQIAAIDHANMAAMMYDMGILFSPDRRVADIAAEIEKGVRFVVIEKESNILAYLSYVIADDTVKVKGIQLRPSAGKYALKQLLSKMALATAQEAFREVRSKVYIANQASLRLHKKLGFIQTQQRGGSVEFGISRQQLSTALCSFGILRQ